MDENDPLPGLDPSKVPQRLFLSQLLFSLVLGLSGSLLFCYLRPRYPQIYSLRTLRRNDIEPLGKSWFKWIQKLYSIKDEEVLALSGLDAYVFLCFFKVSIRIFAWLTLISVVIIGPIRYYGTGYYDHQQSLKARLQEDPKLPPSLEEFPTYLWVYAVFTYVFASLSLYYLLKQTKNIIAIRQNYLGSQNSVTDKTIRLNGIPGNLRSDEALKSHIEDLGLGKVIQVHFNRDWGVLDHFMTERHAILGELERAYCSYLKLEVNIHEGKIPETTIKKLPQDEHIAGKRPTKLLGFLGLTGTKVDTINYNLLKLKNIDQDILSLRQQDNFRPLNSAFVTMESVASAQMIAQAVLDPKVHHLLASLAPSPSDVIWENFAISNIKTFVRNYGITILFVISSVALIFPVSSLAAIINVETITKLWPSLGNFIAKSKWLTTLVTGILPPTLFTLLNVCIPYFYSYLSTKQYFCSNSDVELASVSKNFFYTFFNLFLVFTIAGSAANFWSYFTDTTKIAYQLANSIKKLSLFYNNLILLQGIGIFPYKLMQFGDVLIIGYYKVLQACGIAKVSVRKLRYLYYTPKIFDFGLILPQHILIFVITIIYSVMSTKLLGSGLVYFVLGYFVYKYQLIYSMIHPQHSTGKVWAIIINRLIIGLVLFELAMIGTLALENAVILAISLVPLIGATIWFYYRFEKFYKPLLYFIALRAVKPPKKRLLDQRPPDLYAASDSQAVEDADISTSTDILENSQELTSVESEETTKLLQQVLNSLRKRRSTFDELKDENQNYQYPYVVKELLGPWVGFEGNLIEMVDYSSSQLLKDGNDVVIDVSHVDVNKILDKIANTYSGEKVVNRQLNFGEWQ